MVIGGADSRDGRYKAQGKGVCSVEQAVNEPKTSDRGLCQASAKSDAAMYS